MEVTDPIPRWRTILWRGLRRRCPHCGQGPVYKRWVTLHERCSACGLRYLNDEGDLWAYLVAVDRALFILPLIVLIYFRLYREDSVWFYLFCGGLLLSFVFTLPHRNAVALGVDYLIRRNAGDLAAPETEADKAEKK